MEDVASASIRMKTPIDSTASAEWSRHGLAGSCETFHASEIHRELLPRTAVGNDVVDLSKTEIVGFPIAPETANEVERSQGQVAHLWRLTLEVHIIIWQTIFYYQVRILMPWLTNVTYII